MNMNPGAQRQANVQNQTCCGQSLNVDGSMDPYYQAGLPSGFPLGPLSAPVFTNTATSLQPSPGGTMPITPLTQPAPLTLGSMQYFNGYLKSQIGKRVKVEFMVGSDNFVDRSGILLGVGANYITINETETDDLLICDFFSIKFVTIFR